MVGPEEVLLEEDGPPGGGGGGGGLEWDAMFLLSSNVYFIECVLLFYISNFSFAVLGFQEDNRMAMVLAIYFNVTWNQTTKELSVIVTPITDNIICDS